MDSAIFTLMMVLTSAGVDGTKVVVSLPDGEPLEAMANAIETIANTTKRLEREMKSIEVMLSKLMKGSSQTESKPNLYPTLETTTEPESTMPASTELVKIPYYGVAGASSVWDNDYRAEYAFANLRDGGDCWIAAPSPSLPQLLWFHFSAPHRLEKIGFGGRYNKNGPKSFDVVGSNDCASWTKMLSVKNSGFDVDFEYKSWIIPKKNRRSFACIGLKIFSAISSSHLVVNNINMWEAA